MRLRFVNRGDGNYIAIFDRLDPENGIDEPEDVQYMKDQVCDETGVYGVLLFAYDLEIDESVR